MDASEALVRGSLLITPVAGQRDDHHGGGCALGMIQVATGVWAEHAYPWLSHTALVPLPCEHQDAKTLMGSNCYIFQRYQIRSYIGYLMHLFNYHVMEKGDWTITRLAGWISSVEPKEKPKPQVHEEELVLFEQKEEAHEELASTVAR